MSAMKSLDDQSMAVDLSGLVQLLQLNHLKFEKSEAELFDHVGKLVSFYNKKNPKIIYCKDCKQEFESDDLLFAHQKNSHQDKPQKLTFKDDPIPYQYKEDRQKEWYDEINPIIKMVSAIDPIIMNKYKILFELELHNTTETNPEPTRTILPDGTQSISPQPQQKAGFWSVFKRSPQQRTNRSPYLLEIENIKQKEKIVEDFYDYCDFHNEALEWLELNEAEAHKDMLRIETTEFKKRITRLITSISEGHNLMRLDDTNKGVNVLTSAMALHERHATKSIVPQF